MLTATLLWLLSQLVALVHAQSNFCAPSNVFCASITANDASQSYSISVQTSLQGWTAIGLNTYGMAGCTMIVGWLNSANAPVVSVRYSGGHYLPQPTSDSNIALGGSSSGGVSFSFSIPYAMAGQYFGVQPGQPSNFIYASASAGPSNPNSASSGFGIHEYRGSFSMVIPAQRVQPVPPPPTAVVIPPTTAAPVETTAQAAPASSVTQVTTTDSPRVTLLAPSAIPTSVMNDLAAGVAVSTFCSDMTGTFCITASRAGENVTVTVQSSYTGWVAFGIGSSMTTAKMFVCWLDSSNNPFITQRDSAALIQPPISSLQQFSIASTPATVNISSTSKITFSLILPASLFNMNATTSLIYALSSSPPSTPNSPTSPFPVHSTRGVFSLDISKLGTTTSGEPTTTPNVLLYHGLCMFLAWCILPPVGIFIARYLKERLGHLWYKLHIAIMFFGIASLMALGLLFVELYIPEGAPRFSGSTPHGVMGMLIAFGMYPLQIALGYISNSLFDKERNEIPWWDKLHWMVGRLVVVLAVINVCLGLVLYGAGTGWVVGYWVFVGVVGVGFVVVEKRMGASVHVQKPASP
ncbi:hypothetical protein HDU98_009106 [Podochytrium sp. JEL0797]|nr:hypothetical protein HDU98_009106 [Podochytrium sp. JEL0797]